MGRGGERRRGRRQRSRGRSRASWLGGRPGPAAPGRTRSAKAEGDRRQRHARPCLGTRDRQGCTVTVRFWQADRVELCRSLSIRGGDHDVASRPHDAVIVDGLMMCRRAGYVRDCDSAALMDAQRTKVLRRLERRRKLPVPVPVPGNWYQVSNTGNTARVPIRWKDYGQRRYGYPVASGTRYRYRYGADTVRKVISFDPCGDLTGFLYRYRIP